MWHNLRYVVLYSKKKDYIIKKYKYTLLTAFQFALFNGASTSHFFFGFNPNGSDCDMLMAELIPPIIGGGGPDCGIGGGLGPASIPGIGGGGGPPNPGSGGGGGHRPPEPGKGGGGGGGGAIIIADPLAFGSGGGGGGRLPIPAKPDRTEPIFCYKLKQFRVDNSYKLKANYVYIK